MSEPSTETLPAPPSTSTPHRAVQLAATLWAFRRPAGWLLGVASALGTLIAVLTSDQGPALLAGVARVAERGWPAVALVAVIVSFVAMMRVVGTVGGAISLLHDQLQIERKRTDGAMAALSRVEDNQEQMTVILTRLVDRTQPGTGPAVTMPPDGPQLAKGG